MFIILLKSYEPTSIYLIKLETEVNKYLYVYICVYKLYGVKLSRKTFLLKDNVMERWATRVPEGENRFKMQTGRGDRRAYSLINDAAELGRT